MPNVVDINLLPWREKAKQRRLKLVKLIKLTLIPILLLSSVIFITSKKNTHKFKITNTHEIKNTLTSAQIAWQKNKLLQNKFFSLQQTLHKQNGGSIKIESLQLQPTPVLIQGYSLTTADWIKFLRMLQNDPDWEINSSLIKHTRNNKTQSFKLNLSYLQSIETYSNYNFTIKNPVKVLTNILLIKPSQLKIISINIKKTSNPTIIIKAKGTQSTFTKFITAFFNSSLLCPIKKLSFYESKNEFKIILIIKLPCFSRSIKTQQSLFTNNLNSYSIKNISFIGWIKENNQAFALLQTPNNKIVKLTTNAIFAREKAEILAIKKDYIELKVNNCKLSLTTASIKDNNKCITK